MIKIFSVLLAGLLLVFQPFASAAGDGEEVDVTEPVLVSFLPDGAIGEEWELVGVELLSVQTPVSSSSGLKGVLLSLLGPYDPPVVQYQYQNYNQSYYSYLREVVPDYPFMASVLVLLLFLYGAIRMGCALCRR